MKLNTTYPLNQLLDAVSKASENIFTLVEEMKKEHTTSRAFISFSTEGMLTTSPYSRVTLTRQTSPDRWEGFMETTIHKDGPPHSLCSCPSPQCSCHQQGLHPSDTL